MLDVALLGTGGMMPMPGRYLSALLCRFNGRFILIDCGEGTQVSMKMLGWGFKNVDVICFTHFHGDHISGLPGLLLTIGNAGRTEPLHLVGPVGLEYVVKCLCVIAPELPFELVFTELEPEKNMSVTVAGIDICAYPMRHRIPCLGYTLEVHRKGRFDLKRASALPIPKTWWGRLQRGATLEQDGRVYTEADVLGVPRKGLKVAFCTDSRPVEGLADFVRGADLFICEGLYGDESLAEKAKKHRHMTFSEAAKIAKDGEVGQLWLTHFSPALLDPPAFLKSATDIFANTRTGYDRMHTQLLFEEAGGEE